MIAKLATIEVPDCVAPYNMAPMIIGWSTFVGVVLIVAVAILVGMWIDKR